MMQKPQAGAVEPPTARREAQDRALVDVLRGGALAQGDRAAALRAITEAATRALEVERASVWLYNERRNRIHCVDLYERTPGRHSDGLELAAINYPSYFAALDTAFAIAADDARADPRTGEFRASYLEPLGITSMLDAPIHVQGRLVGVVCHEHVGPPRHWTDDEQNFAHAAAALATLALHAMPHSPSQ